MTIGGIRISKPQMRVISDLASRGSFAETTVDGRTRKALHAAGLVETFIPDATTFSMAARGRVRHLRLTKAGQQTADLMQVMDVWEISVVPLASPGEAC
jgi:hypothetical protein